MARQRRGEPGGDARRRGGSRARLGLLAVVAAAAVTAACPQGGRLLGGPGFAGGGSGGGGTGATSVVGTWRNFTTFFDAASGDTIVSETRWTFAAGGSCSKLVIHTFVNAGVQDTIFQGSCNYTSGGSSVTITFVGSSVPTTFSVGFSGADLLLGGSRFQRVG